MTTHTGLIARLREDYCYCLDAYKARGRIDPQCESCNTKDERDEAADAIESLEQQVAALTKERDDLETECAVHAACTKRRVKQLAATQAREAKLRELWEAVEKEYFARLKEQDEEAAKFEAEKDMYGWNFHKGLKSGLVEFHIYMTKMVKALALPTDDSALMERLKEERERCAQFCEAYDKYDYAVTGRKTLADAIRGLA